MELFADCEPTGSSGRVIVTSNVASGEDVPVEDNETAPAWFRYLPRNIPRPQRIVDYSDDLKIAHANKEKGGVRASINPFGPTSSHARNIENPIREARIRQAKRSRKEFDGNDSMDGCDTRSDLPQSTVVENSLYVDPSKRRKVTVPVGTKTIRKPHIGEAAELFSIVKLS